jgi:hypothetical protein
MYFWPVLNCELCLSFSTARIAVMHHHVWLTLLHLESQYEVLVKNSFSAVRDFLNITESPAYFNLSAEVP